eukprot:363336-Chlamydomonas_euryale.AAC.1
MPRRCKAAVQGAPTRRRAGAGSMRCACRGEVESMPSRCRAGAGRVGCVRRAEAQRVPSRRKANGARSRCSRWWVQQVRWEKQVQPMLCAANGGRSRCSAAVAMPALTALLRLRCGRLCASLGARACARRLLHAPAAAHDETASGRGAGDVRVVADSNDETAGGRGACDVLIVDGTNVLCLSHGGVPAARRAGAGPGARDAHAACFGTWLAFLLMVSPLVGRRVAEGASVTACMM